MNLGIADAAELARQIANGDTQTYSSLRHHQGEKAIRVTERGRKMTSGTNLVARIAFRTILLAANTAVPFKKRLGQFLVEF